MVLLVGCGGTESPCIGVHATITTAYSMTPSCTSPVGVCTAGNVTSANLKGTTWFTALSSQPSSPPGVASYAGDLVITTADGTVTLRDSGLLNSSSGQYVELQEVTSGTGVYLGATGMLVSQGIATATGFEGTLSGSFCAVQRYANWIETPRKQAIVENPGLLSYETPTSHEQ
jgi:hypothetical protein